MEQTYHIKEIQVRLNHNQTAEFRYVLVTGAVTRWHNFGQVRWGDTLSICHGVPAGEANYSVRQSLDA